MNRTTVKTNPFWVIITYCGLWLWGSNLTAQTCFQGYTQRDTVAFEVNLGICEISSAQILQSIGLDGCSSATLTVNTVGLNSSRNVDLINSSTDQIIDNFIVIVKSKSNILPSPLVITISPSDCAANKSFLLDQLNVTANESVRANIHFVSGTSRITNFPIGDTIRIDRIVCGDGYIYKNNVKVFFKPSLPPISGIDYNYDIGFTTRKVPIAEILDALRSDNLFPYSCELGRLRIQNIGPFAYGMHTIGNIYLDSSLIASNIKVNVRAAACVNSLLNIPIEKGQCYINKKDILDTLGFDPIKDNYDLVKLNILDGKTLEDENFTIQGILVNGYNVCNNNITVSYTRISNIADEGNLACNNLLNISLDEHCEVHLNSDVLLQGNYHCYLNYIVKVQDAYGRVVAENHNVVLTEPGTYQVTIKNPYNNNSCWSKIIIEDKHIYNVVCPPDTIECYTSIKPDTSGVGPVFPYVGVSSIFIAKSPERTYDVINTDICGIKKAKYEDKSVSVCKGNFKEIIDRFWTFEDSAGNKDTCTQRLYIKKTFVDSVDMFATFQRDCISDFSILDDRGHPSPEISGYPTLNGGKFQAGVCGVLKMAYTDNVFALCGRSFKILRDWTIIDWCSDQITHRNQIILIEDRKAPTITNVLPDLNLGSHPFNCGAENITLPRPLYTDCGSDTVSTEISYESFNSKNERVIKSNGSSLTIPYIEMHGIETTFDVYYKLTDACGNMARDTIKVRIFDNQAPVAVCDQHTSISIAGNGLAQVKAFTFDDLSVDNCGIAKYEARKLNGSCYIDSMFTELLVFCCDEIGETITVEFKVTDLAGNFNTCMVFVDVYDKFIPIINCPGDVTIDCSDDFDNLTITGQATAIDNCTLDSLYFKDAIHLDECGKGWIERQWRAVDRQGQLAVCTQHITVKPATPFVMASSKYPKDITVNGCLETILPQFTGSPDIADSSCSQIIMTYEDTYFNNVSGACIKIIRDWIILDWCQFSTDNPNVGRWTKSQVIKVVNTTAPTFVNTPTDTVLCVNGPTCSDMITVRAFATDDCTIGENLDWFYEFYSKVSDTTPSRTGTKSFFSGALGPGMYKIKFTVSDGCKNYSSHITTFEVKDCAPPSISCGNVANPLTLNSAGQIDIQFNDLNINATDNCSESQSLSYSFAPDQLINSLTFNCSDIIDGLSQTVLIDIYVTDQQGNQGHCEMSLQIVDNGANVCKDTLLPPASTDTLMAQGLIMTEELESVDDVKVSIKGPNGQVKTIMSNKDGKFEFVQLASNSDYTVTFDKGGEVTDGMTTLDLLYIQRHLLGIRVLDSPYKIIAADVDNSGRISGADLVVMRRILIGIDKDFSSGQKVWRFSKFSHQFADVYNPFPFPENITLDNFRSSQSDINMMAVKIGDVNGSNKISSGLKSNIRSKADHQLIVENMPLKAKEVRTIPVYMSKMTKVSGLQLAMQTTDSKVSIRSGQVKVTEENYYQDKDGKLRFSWINPSDAQWIDAEQPIFYIVVTAARDADLDELISLATNDREALIVNEELHEQTLDLTITKSSIKIDEFDFTANTLKVLGNFPNPFETRTELKFYVPNEQVLSVVMYDIKGRVIDNQKRTFPKGTHSIVLDDSKLSDYKGVIFIHIIGREGKAVHKMLKI